MALFRRLVICSLAAFAGLAGLAAAEKEQPGRVTAVWLDGRRPVGELFVADSKGNPQKLTVGVAGRGAPVELPASGGPVVLLRKAATLPVAADAAAANTAPAYEKAGEVTLPAGKARKVLLLLASTGQAGAPLTVKGVALADDPSTFPPHSVRFVNFLGGELVGKIGDAVKSVPPGSSASFPYPVQAKPEAKETPVFPLALARQLKAGAAPEVLFNGRIEAWAHSRALVVIFPGPTTEADPVVRTILDVVPPSPPPAAKPTI